MQQRLLLVALIVIILAVVVIFRNQLSTIVKTAGSKVVKVDKCELAYNLQP